MKAKDLIAALSKLPPNADVLCYTEDEALVESGAGFLVLEIEDVNSQDAEKTRDKRGKGTLKFGKSDLSSPHVFINVTSDF